MPRVPINPAVTIDISTPEGRKEVLQAVRKVMEEHHEVLERLAKR
ncbi:hypothetical protein [Burkholderia glumae]